MFAAVKAKSLAYFNNNKDPIRAYEKITNPK